MEGPEEVRLDHPPEVAGRGVLHGSDVIDGCVGHDDVDTAESSGGLLDERLDCRRVGHIDLPGPDTLTQLGL